MIALLTDSTSDLPFKQAEQLGVQVVPLSVKMQGKTLQDWREVDPDAVYDHQKAGGTVATSPASISSFVATYKQLLETHEQLVSIHISAQLSDTVKHARRAAEELGATDRILVIDSGLASIPLTEAVLVAQQVMQAGGDFARVNAAVRAVRQQGQAEFTVPSLEYLRRGGRISRTQELMGNLMNLRPVLNFQQGALHPVRRVKPEVALQDIIERLEHQFGNTPVSVAVAHAGRDPVKLNVMRQAIGRSSLKVHRGRFQLIGPVIGAHVGPGMYGVSAAPADI